MFPERRTIIPGYSRAVLIYNPQAGKLRNGCLRLKRAAAILQAVACEVIPVATAGPRTAGPLAAEAIRDGADLIIASGGDGTISEVVDGIAGTAVPLGILPAGTANVLAHEIGMPRGVTAAARQIAQCVPERVSVGELETSDGERRHFLLMAGAGFDAQIIYELSEGLKSRWGKASYYLGALAKLGRNLGELDVRVNGMSRRCTFALVSKVRNYGGDFEIATEVTMRDPSFEVVLFQARNSWRYLQYLLGLATRQLARTDGVAFLRADCVELRAAGNRPVFLHADGELVGRLPVRLRVVPDALTLLCPRNHRFMGLLAERAAHSCRES